MDISYIVFIMKAISCLLLIIWHYQHSLCSTHEQYFICLNHEGRSWLQMYYCVFFCRNLKYFYCNTFKTIANGVSCLHIVGLSSTKCIPIHLSSLSAGPVSLQGLWKAEARHQFKPDHSSGDYESTTDQERRPSQLIETTICIIRCSLCNFIRTVGCKCKTVRRWKAPGKSNV